MQNDVTISTARCLDWGKKKEEKERESKSNKRKVKKKKRKRKEMERKRPKSHHEYGETIRNHFTKKISYLSIRVNTCARDSSRRKLLKIIELKIIETLQLLRKLCVGSLNMIFYFRFVFLFFLFFSFFFFFNRRYSKNYQTHRVSIKNGR